MAITVGSHAPDFTLPDLQGQPVQLSRLRSAPVLLNFFQDNCSWCQAEMPRLAEVYRRHADLQVRVLGISPGDAARAAQFARDKNLDFPVVTDGAGQTLAEYSIERVPSLVLVDENGLVARVYEGSSEQLAGIVEQTLLAAARGDELPDYSLVGNGCAPD